MKRRIRVRGVRRREPDLDKLAFALLRLVEQLTPEERHRLQASCKPMGDGGTDQTVPGAGS
ncbi:MAG TPA: hypothetical protein VM938_06120 [Acidimicrobiales bacterium]|nr:hypothetical protein [Acidimicrobiales bacterium]